MSPLQLAPKLQNQRSFGDREKNSLEHFGLLELQLQLEFL